MQHILCFTVAVIALLGLASSQDANCDFTVNVIAGNQYSINSPGYPNSYNPGVQCRWIATCPNGYNCRIDCSEINLPQTQNCNGDRLLVSRTGDPTLSAAERYCGRGTLTLTSSGRTLSMGLLTSRGSGGGRFICTLTAQSATTTPPSTCSCGYKKTNRIVGGQETGVNEYPMMAGLMDNRISQIICGAVIIYNHYLLTAAHCLTNMKTTDLSVVVGEHNVNFGDSPATQTLQVQDYLIHPQYNPSNYDSDIAIVLTDRNMVFSDRVGPACLPFKFTGQSFAGSRVTALGWGTQFPGGPTSDYLQKVVLDVISQASCRSSISTLTARQVCTYTPGKDACQSDSGGPLLFEEPSTGLVYNMGIISFGRFCASDTPGTNTRVTEFLNWIQSNTPDASYCRK